ncbi:intraflagellar transport protein 25 homolog [Clupea harengus]|uniref:Intraflagellar transport protein 25 homolog n=1 Tax=Clupea harengus TaxID=7950 RepID=A0A6P8FS05_CLUHA|nr:intraflagellar transport protein 25 homolog [Clupea harengus]
MKTKDLRSSGTYVSLATSCDKNYPPEHIIDGNGETFWMSTGMFPQAFTISFPSPTEIADISLQSYNVKGLKIEKCISEEVGTFETLAERELEHTEELLQALKISLNTSTTLLRFTITSGYDHFVSVNEVHMSS